MTRILLIISTQPDFQRASDSDIRERLINTYPNLAEFEFTYLGIENVSETILSFELYLEILTNDFKPDYIMVHTGSGFQRKSSQVIRSLANLAKKHPNLKVGFQRGNDKAMKIALLGESHFGIGVDVSKTISVIENDKVFQETSELKQLVEKVFYPHN